MSQPKPTKEQEQALKNVLEDECLTWESEKEPLTEKICDFFVYTCWYKIRSAYSEVKWLFQRIFRKNHLSDLDTWNCGFDIARDSLKKIKAFRAMNRHGHPGTLNSMEEWDKILDEIILKLDLWIRLSDGDDYEAMCIEHGWEYPYAKKIENKSVEYVFRRKDGSCTLSGDLDYDIKNPDYTYCSRQVSYSNNKASKELQQKAEKGFLLFTKWLPNMWD